MTGGIRALVHWMHGSVLPDGDSGSVEVWEVLGTLAELLGESVVIRNRAGWKGYTESFDVGPVEVHAAPGRPEQGVLVVVRGDGCDELGLLRVAEVWGVLGLRAGRLDVAFDGVPFTPADLLAPWLAGDVRTRVKVPAQARADRQVRRYGWHESPEGDTFTAGSRASEQFLRCYDSRGETRLELELKDRTAAAAAEMLLGGVLLDGGKSFALDALGWVRRFVDFVDASSSAHSSRRVLLPFWEAFLAGAEKAQVTLGGAVRRSVEQVREWVGRQVAPSLGLLLAAFGRAELEQLARRGMSRFTGRHRAALREFKAVGLAV